MIEKLTTVKKYFVQLFDFFLGTIKGKSTTRKKTTETSWTLLGMHAHLISNKCTSNLCHGCCLGKYNRIRSPKYGNIYIISFELIHVCLWGLAPMIYSNGFTYYISFVDTFAKFSWIYFLKTKQKISCITCFSTILCTHSKSNFQNY